MFTIGRRRILSRASPSTSILGAGLRPSLGISPSTCRRSTSIYGIAGFVLNKGMLEFSDLAGARDLALALELPFESTTMQYVLVCPQWKHDRAFGTCIAAFFQVQCFSVFVELPLMNACSSLRAFLEHGPGHNVENASRFLYIERCADLSLICTWVRHAHTFVFYSSLGGASCLRATSRILQIAGCPDLFLTRPWLRHAQAFGLAEARALPSALELPLEYWGLQDVPICPWLFTEEGQLGFSPRIEAASK